MKRLILLLALALSPAFSFANSDLTAQFTKEFYSHYQSGKCGQNIMNLIDRAETNHIDMSRANLIEIKNEGFSVFGLVNAEHVRGGGKLYKEIPTHGIKWEPGEANWHFHAILELDGHIYDFDFGNEAAVVSVKAYLEKMFLNELPKEKGGMFDTDRNEKLDKYIFTVIPASEIHKRVDRPTEQKMSMRDFMNRF